MMRLFSIRLIYTRAANEAAVRTAVSAAPDEMEAIEWLRSEVRRKGELPGYQMQHAKAEDVTDYARAFVIANPGKAA
jgi:hypothetical protein